MSFHDCSEILRVVDSLQLTAEKKVATPADWKVSMPKHLLGFDLNTVKPCLSGFLDYPDFFSGPNLVMNIY